MGNKSLLIVLWGVGTGVAALVAWQSLSLVRASTETDALGNTGFESRVDGADPASTPDVSSGTGDGGAAVGAEDQAATSEPEPGAEPEPATSPSSSTTPEASAGTGSGSVSTTAGAGPDPTTAAPATTADNSQDRTFDLVGGTTAVRFSPTEIMILWATPAPGFTADWHPDDGGMEVEFRSANHKSKLEVWWADGPRFDVSEEDD